MKLLVLTHTHKQYIQQQPLWIPELTQYYQQNMTVKPLITYIINNDKFIISTDWVKGKRKSGGSWLIVLEVEIKIIN